MRSLILLFLLWISAFAYSQQPILSSFFYLAGQPIDTHYLNEYKAAIGHLDVLNYSVLSISNNSTLPVSQTNGDNLTLIHHWLKQNKLHTQIVAAIGHWETRAADQIFLDKKTREKFVKSVISLLQNKQYGLSGINLDWENYFDNDLTDVDGFPEVVKALRLAMDQAGLQSDTITLDVPIGVVFAKRYPDPSKWAPYVNWANVMAYTFYGDVVPYAELDGTLGTVTAPYGGPRPRYKTISILSTLNYYNSHGLSRDKTVIALPMYGMMNLIYHGDKKHHYGLRQPVIRVDGNHVAVRSIPYKDCYNHYGIYSDAKMKGSIHQYNFKQPTSITDIHSYWVTVRHKDKRVKQKTYQFVSYPDPRYMQQTTTYLMKQHYHGISTWALNYDLPYTNTHSLLQTAYKAVHTNGNSTKK